jgi:hypothetical protein
VNKKLLSFLSSTGVYFEAGRNSSPVNAPKMFCYDAHRRVNENEHIQNHLEFLAIED